MCLDITLLIGMGAICLAYKIVSTIAIKHQYVMMHNM